MGKKGEHGRRSICWRKTIGEEVMALLVIGSRLELGRAVLKPRCTNMMSALGDCAEKQSSLVIVGGEHVATYGVNNNREVSVNKYPCKLLSSWSFVKHLF